ncbi:MAG: type IV pilus twitching motility protein PilT [Synechococcales bacterium]|nr:type IV pilus twitching motility protein PilT [Synechococcales bacterium]
MTEARRPPKPPIAPPPPPGRPMSRPGPSPVGASASQAPTQTLSAPSETIIKPNPGVAAKPSAPPGIPSRPPAPPPPAAAKPAPATPQPVAPPPPGNPPAPQSNRRQRAPGAPTLEQIVKEAYDKGYSDIHLGVGEVPRFRDRGEIMPTEYPVTDKPTFYSWIAEVLPEPEIQKFKDTLDYDGAADYEFARVRINLFDTLLGPAMVMRLIPKKILTLDQLNAPSVFRDICHYHKGLILITGPTGSGKSTTMAAMIDYMNREMPKHIITIEDPIEFVHQSRKSLIKQREVGQHTQKFDAALKASLREDPDLILVGEMRDKETVNTALKAAQTGHLVMGTLHTNSAVKTIERILNLYEPDQQGPMRVSIAESLVAVIAQGLCRTTDGKRAAFHDIMINTDAIKDYIMKGALDEIEALIPKCTFDGMCTMNQSLYKLYESGRITEETALEMSPKPNEMAQILRGRV